MKCATRILKLSIKNIYFNYEESTKLTFTTIYGHYECGRG